MKKWPSHRLPLWVRQYHRPLKKFPQGGLKNMKNIKKMFQKIHQNWHRRPPGASESFFSRYFYDFLLRRDAIWTHGDLCYNFLYIFFLTFSFYFLAKIIRNSSKARFLTQTDVIFFQVETTQNDNGICHFRCMGAHFITCCQFYVFCSPVFFLFFFFMIGYRAEGLFAGGSGEAAAPRWELFQ